MRRLQSELPFLDEAREGLVRHFGLADFRPGQAEVVSAVLSGRNSVVVMPTGAGKSLCYQLPATLLPGVTLVISPLISLMQDQVEQLDGRGISATFINSTLSDLERAERQRKLAAGEYKLVYVAPERFRSQYFLDALAGVKVELLAIDEAHCISQWGHDFRPDYAQLGQVRKRLRPPRTVALTATATPEVQQDITRVLLMKDPKIFVAGFDRANLFLEVAQVSGDEDKRNACAELAREGGSGIVYCSTRKAAEMIHGALDKRRVNPVLYHAGMDDDDRRRAQEDFMSRPDSVAVATNAFGMGIDKPDIRFVVHANIPRAVEAYYQEIGRAGRDGKPARAVLLFNHADVFTQERMIESSHPDAIVFRDVWNALVEVEEHSHGVKALAHQVGSHDLEVSAVLRYLERAGKVSRGSRGEGAWSISLLPKAVETHPKTPQAIAVLDSLVANFPLGKTSTTELKVIARRTQLTEDEVRHALALLERAGAVETRKPFTGRTIRALERTEFDQLGLDFTRMREQLRRSLTMLKRMTDYAYAKRCRRAFILRYFGEQLEVACSGCDVCSGPRLKVSASEKREPGGKAVGVPGAHSALAVEELRKFRRGLSLDLGVAPYIIFNDATMFALATALPTNRTEFLNVKGAGESRWEKFGPKIIEICVNARAAGHAPVLSVRATKSRR